MYHTSHATSPTLLYRYRERQIALEMMKIIANNEDYSNDEIGYTRGEWIIKRIIM